jgi:hypothetical protein
MTLSKRYGRAFQVHRLRIELILTHMMENDRRLLESSSFAPHVLEFNLGNQQLSGI